MADGTEHPDDSANYEAWLKASEHRPQPNALGYSPSNPSFSQSIDDLRTDWRKPRYVLPSLKYFSPVREMFALAYAVMVFSILTLASFQEWHAYSSGEGLDVSSTDFISIAALFLVAAIGAAAELRRITLRWGLRRQAGRQIVTAEYRIALSPVEAGVMMDAYSDSNEVAAVLSSLQANGNLTTEMHDGAQCARIANRQTLGRDEKVFVDNLFGADDLITTDYLRRHAAEAGKHMQKEAYQRMLSAGDMPVLTGLSKVNFFVLKVLTIVGFGIGAMLFIAIFMPESYVINYPRYPVYAWQLIFIALTYAVLLVVPAQAYFTRVFSREGMEKYREAAGLYGYIEIVLMGHFDNETLAKSERDYYLPYAQAFGLEPAYFDFDKNTQQTK